MRNVVNNQSGFAVGDLSKNAPGCLALFLFFLKGLRAPPNCAWGLGLSETAGRRAREHRKLSSPVRRGRTPAWQGPSDESQGAAIKSEGCLLLSCLV